jgi:5'-deoxynucleotidase YfbR-like HD superfamily hydrolase
MSRKTVDEAIALAHLALALGRVDRITRHEDGVRPETDTDHTMMLTLVACQLAPSRMDRSKICQFAVVHDLVEAVKGVGDTQTLTISDADRKLKEERERLALEQLRERFGKESWLIETLETYEEQMEPEARFVKVLDKVMPKLTHLFNGAVAAKSLGIDPEGFMVAHQKQFADLKKKYPDQPEALELLQETCQLSELAFISKPGTDIVGSQKRWAERERQLREAAFMERMIDSSSNTEGLPMPPTKDDEP